MPIETVRVQDVQRAFEDAVRQASGSARPLDEAHYTRLHRGVINSTWQQVAPGVEVLQAVGCRLFRVRWEVIIDRMDTCQPANLHSQAELLRQAVSSVFGGTTMSVAFQQPTEEEVGGGTRASSARLTGSCSNHRGNRAPEPQPHATAAM